jgi:hypothetical protein
VQIVDEKGQQNNTLVKREKGTKWGELFEASHGLIFASFFKPLVQIAVYTLPPPRNNASADRLARANLHQNYIRANVATLALFLGGGGEGEYSYCSADQLMTGWI